MQAADMVYYLYTDKHGVPLKLPAVVIGVDDNGIAIRVGRYDVHSKEVSTIESVVAAESLQLMVFGGVLFVACPAATKTIYAPRSRPQS